MCFSGNIWNRVGALYDSSLTEWSKIGHGATFPSVADHLGLLHLVSSVAGVGTHLLTVVHNGKPKSQDNQHRHCFNSRSFPAWIYWDGRGVPSFSVLQYLLLDAACTPMHPSVVMQPGLIHVWVCILHPCKGTSGSTNVNKKFSGFNNAWGIRRNPFSPEWSKAFHTI